MANVVGNDDFVRVYGEYHPVLADDPNKYSAKRVANRVLCRNPVGACVPSYITGCIGEGVVLNNTGAISKDLTKGAVTRWITSNPTAVKNITTVASPFLTGAFSGTVKWLASAVGKLTSFTTVTAISTGVEVYEYTQDRRKHSKLNRRIQNDYNNAGKDLELRTSVARKDKSWMKIDRNQKPIAENNEPVMAADDAPEMIGSSWNILDRVL